MPKISQQERKQERAQDEAEEQHIREEIKACTASFAMIAHAAPLLPLQHSCWFITLLHRSCCCIAAVVASQLLLHRSCFCIAAAIASTLLIADAASLMHQARAHREAGAIASHACITAAGASHCCIAAAAASQPLHLLHSHCCIAAWRIRPLRIAHRACARRVSVPLHACITCLHRSCLHRSRASPTPQLH